MPLGAADLTRIYKYQAFTLGSQAGGSLTYTEVLTLIQQQIDAVNAADVALSTTFATEIQADLDSLDTLDASMNSNASNGGIKVLGIGSGIEYFEDGATKGFGSEMGRLRERVARVLSQSYADSDGGSGVSLAYRG
ncbi:MAG: hypothetical protein AAFX78_03480 [Cyanobacteria bacterium J06638_20]